jgi:NAD-dependent SIR2 family protein deacetylase
MKKIDKLIEQTYSSPFCRRCKAPLEKEWLEKLKRERNLPLCPKCLPVMLEQYKKTIKLWQKFNQR